MMRGGENQRTFSSRSHSQPTGIKRHTQEKSGHPHTKTLIQPRQLSQPPSPSKHLLKERHPSWLLYLHPQKHSMQPSHPHLHAPLFCCSEWRISAMFFLEGGGCIRYLVPFSHDDLSDNGPPEGAGVEARVQIKMAACVCGFTTWIIMGEIQQIAREVFRSGEACLCLESLDLQELPPEIFADGTRNFSSVTTLKLDYNDLTFLPSEINALTGLKELSAIGNGLNRLPDSIGQLTNLEGVLLNDNNLTHLPATLAALRKLRVLNLVGNELQTWNEEFSAAFSESITHLHLDENKLSSLPESFGSMSKLRVLELGDNSIPSLPETFGNLQELEILNLSRNKLTELPRSFADLPNLVALDLTANKLENLPDTFKSSRKLQRLFLDKNSVKLLPAWFEQLEKITEIGLADNLLHGDSLSSGFGSASGSTLKILDLAGNSITTLPETLGNLKALESLHLGSTIPELERRGFQNGNSLSKLPENFGGMSNLRKLRLDENKLYELPESFGHLENLEWLELGQNLLTELPESFCCLTQLSYAQLSRNQLKSLPQNFGNLTSLIDLRLDNNNLTDIPDSFANLKDLQTLDLFHNKLSTIPKVLLQLQKLIRLDLDGNNLKIKSDKVPKLTAQIKYPERDSNLKDNWRGRTRQDYIPLSGDDTVEVLRDVEEEEDDRLDAEDTEEELSYNESALIRAMRRGLSIWKSHDGNVLCAYCIVLTIICECTILYEWGLIHTSSTTCNSLITDCIL